MENLLELRNGRSSTDARWTLATGYGPVRSLLHSIFRVFEATRPAQRGRPPMLSKPAVLLRITVRRRVPGVGAVHCHSLRAQFRAHHRPPQGLSRDPRLSETGGVIQDDFAVIRENYQVPKNPIVLAHGLLGFDEIHPAGSILPGIQYWSGIVDALAKKNVEVITVAVPPSECIEVRAQRLAEAIERSAGGRAVNIIAYVLLDGITVRINANEHRALDTAWSGDTRRTATIAC